MKILGATAVSGTIFHFIGMGGIGMSALAGVLNTKGFNIQGSDLSYNKNMKRLKKEGVKTFTKQCAQNIPDKGVVVVSTAIQKDNVELIEAEKKGLTIAHRADILAQIMANYKTIAVAGTHGKTSTTALIYTVLQSAGLDVGIINGGILNDLGTNAKLGTSEWLVVEADESDNSFSKLTPTLSVITNLEPEHMETFGTEQALFAAYRSFMKNTKEDGALVLCADDPQLEYLSAGCAADVVTYGLEDNADVYAKMYCASKAGMAFDAVLRGGILEDCTVAMPGTHFVQNALAALAVAQLLALDLNLAAKGLEAFAGVGRRFTKVGTFDGADIIDDYAHHPTEISATLEAAKQRYAGKVIAVIQPHRYSRLKDLMDEFAASVKVADDVVLMPVYAAGEQPIEGVSHKSLADKIEADVSFAEDADDLADYLDGKVKKGDAVLCMGAGSITAMAQNLADL